VLLYKESKNNNPTFNAGIRWLAVTTTERVFIFCALPNGTHEILADFQNVAPFYMNETFPPELFRRDSAYSLENTGADIANLILSRPELTVPGQNESLNNFVPLGLDLGAVTPTSATCFLATAIFDDTPGVLAPGLVDSYEVVEAFLNGAIKPFFAPFNCPVIEFSKPGVSAGSASPGVASHSNILINGVYQ
jgi:hypothetical protein